MVHALLRLGFLCSSIGLAFVAGLIGDAAGVPGSRARIAMAGSAVDIELWGGAGFEAITFGTECNLMLRPGLICSDTLVIRNAGGLDFTYTIEAWSDVNTTDDGPDGLTGDVFEDCIGVNLGTSSASGLDAGSTPFAGPLSAGHLPVGGSDTWVLAITVDDDNACQGRTATIFAHVVATARGDNGGEGRPGGPTTTPAPQQPDDGREPPPHPTTVTPGPSPDVDRTPLPPADGFRPFPPATGDGGLIGTAPEHDGPDTALIIMTVALVAVATACLYGLAIDKRRRQ